MVHFRTHPQRLCTHPPPSFLGLATTSGYARLQRTWPRITTYTCDHFSDGVYDHGRLRHTHTATAVAASTGPMTEAERRSVRRAYTAVDLRKVDPLPRFPFPANVDVAISLGQFIATCNLVLGEILVLCDDSENSRSTDLLGW